MCAVVDNDPSITYLGQDPATTSPPQPSIHPLVCLETSTRHFRGGGDARDKRQHGNFAKRASSTYAYAEPKSAKKRQPSREFQGPEDVSFLARGVRFLQKLYTTATVLRPLKRNQSWASHTRRGKREPKKFGGRSCCMSVTCCFCCAAAEVFYIGSVELDKGIINRNIHSHKSFSIYN